MCMSAKGWLLPGSEAPGRKYFLGIPRNLKEGVSAGSSELIKDYKTHQRDQMYGHWKGQIPKESLHARPDTFIPSEAPAAVRETKRKARVAADTGAASRLTISTPLNIPS